MNNMLNYLSILKKIDMDPNGFKTVLMCEVFNMRPDVVELSYGEHISPKVFGIFPNKNGLIRGGELD